MQGHTYQDRESNPALTLLCSSVLICGLLLAGCAVPPSGPVVSHSIERFEGRSDGLVCKETWRDKAFTHGWYLFADPAMQSVHAWHTNQAALGGCSHFDAGSVTIVVDSNLVPAITAAGTATGNIIGAAVKTAVK